MDMNDRNPREPGRVPRTYHLRPAAAAGDEGAEGFLTLRDVVDIVRRHLWLIVIASLLGLGGTLWWLSTEVPLYQAGSLIRLTDARGQLAPGLVSAQPVAAGADPVLSEMMVLQGRGVLGEVVDREGLRLLDPERGTAPSWLTGAAVSLPPDAYVELAVRFERDGWAVVTARGQEDLARGDATDSSRGGGQLPLVPYGKASGVEGVRFTVASPPGSGSARLIVYPRDLAIDLLQGGLSVRPRKGTDGVDVAFTSPDPAASVKLVNTIVQTYQEVNARNAQQQATRRRIFLENQLRETDSLLMEAQAELSSFRAHQQVYSSRDQLAAQQSAMLEIDLRRNELDADRRTYHALLEGLEQARASGERRNLAALVSVPGVAENPVVAQLYGQLQSYHTARDSATMGPWASALTHPDIERLDRLIESTEEQLLSAVRSHIAVLDERIAQLGGLRSRNASAMGRPLDAEAEEVRLLGQVESLQSVGNQLRSEYQLARMDEAVEAGQVEIVNVASRAAQVPTRHGLKLFLGSTIGLMIGLSIAFLRENLNSALFRKEDVESVLRVPSLAVIPRLPIANGHGGGRVARLLPGAAGRAKRKRVAARGNNGSGGAASNGLANGGGRHASLVAGLEGAHRAGTEAYRTLRTNLLFSQAAGSLQSIVITSPGPEEGKTVTVGNLALAFAQQGLRVLLVDSDLRRPRLAARFGLPKSPGLTDVLTGAIEVKKGVRQTDIRGLHLLPSGKIPPNPSELLGGCRMERLLDGLAEHYDVILLDSPPILAAPDAAVLGAVADGVLVVVRAGDTDRKAAEHAIQQLERVGARVVGAVLNDPDARVPRYGSYYMYSYYAEPVAT